MGLLKQFLVQLSNAGKIFREKGVLAGLVELGEIISRIFYRREEYIVIQYELSQQSVSLDPKPDLDIRQVAKSEELTSLRQMADESDMTRFHNLFNHDSVAFIAFQDGQPAGYCWASEKFEKALHRVPVPLPVSYTHLTLPTKRIV